MTREEQITQFSELETTLCKRISNDYGCALEEGIIIGAKWADKNPKEGLVSIDKVCEYLQDVLYEVATGVTCTPDVMSIESTTMEDFINNFRKAMEE